MSIFRRNSSAAGAGEDTAAGAAGQGGTVTHIAAGTRIQGEVAGSSDVQIEGEVDGRVAVQALVVVGVGGAVAGPLHGRVVRVAGRVAGRVTAVERVEVAATGSVEGDLAAPRVVIAEGAFFRGQIEMRSDHDGQPRRDAEAGAEAADRTGSD
jgi:cytoskeletal protein CcmA (bactofilin family)